MFELQLMKDMTDSQRLMFQSRFNAERKSFTTALLLCLFLGGLGAHHFYMSKVGLGILYTLFCWTFIPGIIAFIELFLLKSRVEQYNNTIASQIAAVVKN